MNRQGLAKSVIDIDSVHGIIFQHPEKLTVQTRNLGDFHSNLPKQLLIVVKKSIQLIIQMMIWHQFLAI